MNLTDIPLDLGKIRLELKRGIRECSERGLIQTTKWLTEINYALKDTKIPHESDYDNDQVSYEETEVFSLAKSYFNCQEYDRAAYFLENCTHVKCVFLLKFSQYMSSEKKRLDNLTEGAIESTDSSKPHVLLDLLAFFKSNTNSLDGYLYYLWGVVLVALDLRSEAIQVLCACINQVPWLWSAWQELSKLVSGADEMKSLNLPRNWMLYFFTGHTFLQLKLTEQALEVYTLLQNSGFQKSTFVMAQLAVTQHDRRDIETSLSTFKELSNIDPYRLEDWDIYSHILYLQDKRTDLANLAQRAIKIDKYRVETCCVIGNYYSLRNEHQKAVMYFQRGLCLDPQYLSAWILMGHEFIELQNSNAAIQCYRQALEVNRNDYRAWNGLGQAYEILGLNSYCIYYYSRAAQLKPDDSRMLVALGEAYEKMDKVVNALKCYYRAHCTGDIEGMALFKLAKLYDRIGLPRQAAAAYATAINDPSNAGSRDLPAAYRYLADFALKVKVLDYAAHFAYKCLDFEATKEEGKALLKAISDERVKIGSDKSQPSEYSPFRAKSPTNSPASETPQSNPPTVPIRRSSRYKI